MFNDELKYAGFSLTKDKSGLFTEISEPPMAPDLAEVFRFNKPYVYCPPTCAEAEKEATRIASTTKPLCRSLFTIILSQDNDYYLMETLVRTI